jgi:hypothetical protein
MGYKPAVSTGLLIVSLAVAVAGCGSAKPQVAPKPVLRGVPVSKFNCPPQPTSPAAPNAYPIVGVQALLLCPLNTPGVPTKAVTITNRHPQFATLLAALSVPDEPLTTGACPAFADLPQVVLARTPHGAYQLSIPVDACHHYQQRALESLNRARVRGQSHR